MTGRQCTHARKGIVSNQQFTNDMSRALYSRAVCDRPECIAAAIRWAERGSKETATYLSDVERQAAK